MDPNAPLDKLCGQPTKSGAPCQAKARYCPHHGPSIVEITGAGRNPSYDPKHCQKIIEMASEGMVPVEWAVEFGVVRTTLREWCQRHPEFLTAYAQARETSQAWWIQMGRKGMTMGKEFNERQWKTMVYNLFREEWMDERNINIRGTMITLTPEIMARLPDPVLSRIQAGEDASVVLASMATEVLAKYGGSGRPARLGPGNAGGMGAVAAEIMDAEYEIEEADRGEEEAATQDEPDLAGAQDGEGAATPEDDGAMEPDGPDGLEL